MALNYVPINRYLTKFYQYENNFKGFSKLSEEQLVDLTKKVYRHQELMSKTSSNISIKLSKLEIYNKTLQYLTNSNIHFDLDSYDERIAYLILMADPNLVTFKEFLKMDLISKEEISLVKEKKKRNRLSEMRNQSLLAYKARVTEQIGFFDPKLLKYEELFFKKFFNDKELITEIGNDNCDKLMLRGKLLPDFNSISDERYEDLTNIAQIWLSLVPEKYNSKVATYSVTSQKKLLGLNNLAEQLAMFILLTDSDLDLLKIYEEESTMKKIEKRSIEQFGFFNKDLLVLEMKYHDRFCPDKKLSAWTKTKKD